MGGVIITGLGVRKECFSKYKIMYILKDVGFFPEVWSSKLDSLICQFMLGLLCNIRRKKGGGDGGESEFGRKIKTDELGRHKGRLNELI